MSHWNIVCQSGRPGGYAIAMVKLSAQAQLTRRVACSISELALEKHNSSWRVDTDLGFANANIPPNPYLFDALST